MVKKHFQSAVLAAALVLVYAASMQAQSQAADPRRDPNSSKPIKVTVTISRFQGEKRVSNLPYTLSADVSAGGREGANLRMGTSVPITSMTTPQGGGAPVSSVTYRDVGTNIDCTVFSLAASNTDDAAGYKVQISIEESSVYDDPAAKGVVQIGRPTVRSFRTMGSVWLRDGQSTQMSNTPDKISGETVKVDVALAVVK